MTEATCGNKVLPGVHWQLGEQNQDGKEKGNQPLTLQPACGKSSDDIPELTWQTGWFCPSPLSCPSTLGLSKPQLKQPLLPSPAQPSASKVGSHAAPNQRNTNLLFHV